MVPGTPFNMFNQTVAGWSSADLAATVRTAVIALLVPPVVFTAIAVGIERRTGRRGVRVLWAAATALVLAYVVVGALLLPVRTRLAATIGVVPFVVFGGALFTVSFASSAAAIAATGVTSRHPRAKWVRGLAGMAAGSIGMVLVIVGGVLLELAGVW